jgi:hypothetical protein
VSGAVGAFDSHLEQWLDAEPELRLARLFVAEAREPRIAALEAIGHELHAALFEVADDRIAQAKLAWWMEELAQRPRHPLTRGLAEASAGSQAAVAPLREACAALLRFAQQDSVESMDQLISPLARAADGLVRARARGAGPAISPRALAAARLVFAARDWLRFARPERAWLPLDLLARAGVDRAGAVGSVPVVTALLRGLCDAMADVPARDLRGIDGARVAAARTWAARMAGAPRALLDGRLAAPHVALVFGLWRVGRRR